MSLPSPAPPASQNGTTDSTVEKSTSIAKGTPKKEKKQVQAKKNVNDNKSSGKFLLTTSFYFFIYSIQTKANSTY